MRNLKRALSLTLASVMLLGMMVVGTSAASFPDVTAEDNVEAIEVLAAVKVLQGYDDGQYHADTPVTRNQMATIICRMMGWRDSDYAGLNTFPDVPDWAANYVAACVANGIVNGRDDGRFHGDDTVTATEAASMMLRALGYTRMPVGADWARAVTQQASRINLFESLNVGAYTALTRGDVAQLSLNTLQATLVDVKDNTLNISGGTSDNPFNISGGQIDYIVRTSQNTKITGAFDDTVEGGSTSTTGTSGQTVELGEHVFNGELKKRTVNQTDNMERPAVTWIYKNATVGTYATDVEHTVYVPYASTAKTVEKLVQDIDKSYTVPAADGVSPATYKATKIYVNGKDNSGVAWTKAYTPAVGDKLEIFMDKNNPGYVATVSITHKTVDKMTSNVATRVDGKDTLVRLPGVAGLDTFKAANTSDTVHGWEGLAEDDIVLFYQDKDNEFWVERAESFTGTMTSVESGTRGRMTISGTRYDKSGATATLSGLDVTKYSGKDSTWYVDNDQNIVWVEGIETTELAYIVAVKNGSGWDTGSAVTGNKKVLLLLPDGTMASGETEDAATENTFVRYSVTDGVYSLTAVGGYSAGNAGHVTYVDGQAFGLKKGTPSVKINSANTSVATNSDTVFFIRDWDGTQSASKDTYTKYLGYNAVPDVADVTADDPTGSTDAGKTAVAYVGSDGYADIVVLNTGSSITSESSATDLIYIVKSEYETIYDSDGKVSQYTMQGIRNGGEEIETITFDKGKLAVVQALKTNGADKSYIVRSYNSKNEITSVTDAAGTPAANTAIADGQEYYLVGAGYTKGVANAFTLGGTKYGYTSATKVYYLNKDSELVVYTPDQLPDKSTDSTYVAVRASKTSTDSNYDTINTVFIREKADAAVIQSATVPTVTIADSTNAGSNGKVAASATVSIGALNGAHAGTITVNLKSGGLDLANGDKITFTVTPTDGTITASTGVTAAGAVTVTYNGTSWSTPSVAVVANGVTSTYTVNVSAASTDAGITCGTATANITDTTGGAGNSSATVGTPASPANGASAVDVTFTAGGNTAAKGDTIVFKVSPASNVTLTGAAADGTKEVTITYGDTDWGTGTVTATAPAGNTVTYTFTVK